MSETPDRPAYLTPKDDEFVVKLLRSLRRDGAYGVPLAHNLRKCYGGVIRALEKRIIAERYS